jgi:hypothetical protein
MTTTTVSNRIVTVSVGAVKGAFYGRFEEVDF